MVVAVGCCYCSSGVFLGGDEFSVLAIDKAAESVGNSFDQQDPVRDSVVGAGGCCCNVLDRFDGILDECYFIMMEIHGVV